MNEKETGFYESIIHLTHHISPNRKRMKREDRAAQFASFQALTGFGECIDESARVTDHKTELEEDQKLYIDRILNELSSKQQEHPLITVEYFIADKYKPGGKCVIKQGNFKKTDEFEKKLVFTDGETIKIEDILTIETDIKPVL